MTMIWFLILAVVCPKPGTADRSACCHNDPHCVSFDGLAIEYQATCDVVLLDECSGPNWLGPALRVIGRVQSCRQRDNPFGPAPSCVQEIQAIINGVKYRLVLDNNLVPQFQIGNQQFTVEGDQIWFQSLHFMVAAAYREGTGTQSRLYLLFQSAENQDEYIRLILTAGSFSVEVSAGLEERLSNRICGLFGNMNNNRADDGLDPQHVIPGECRGITPGRRKKRTATFEFCETKGAEARARKECAIINQKNGPFKNCYKKNTQRQQMFRNCVNDVCVDKKYKCASIEGYATSCSIFGVCNGDWRAKTGCKLQCPNGMKYYTKYYPEKNPTCLHRYINKCVTASSSQTHWGRRGRGRGRKSKVEKCAKRKIKKLAKKGRQLCFDGCACPDSKIWDPSAAKCVNVSNCKDPFTKQSEISDLIKNLGRRR